MQDVFALEKDTEIPAGDSYVTSYPHLVGYFETLGRIEPADLVRGAHMAYGWMPRILSLNLGGESSKLQRGADLLNNAREQGQLSQGDVETLASLINNSVVGASKLLHFVQPYHFPIWDSNLYEFVYEKAAYAYRVNSAETYMEFFGTVGRLAEREEAQSLTSSVAEKLGYEVTPIRAIELVMFLNSGAKNR